MSPTRYRVWDGSTLLANGGPALIGPVATDNTLTRAQRAALVPLTYIPNRYTNGLLPGWDAKKLTPVYPAAGQTSITLTAGQTYTNKLFWCEVKIPRTGVGTTGPTLDNCWAAGQDPRTIATSGAAESRCITASDNDVSHWTMRDSVISMTPWMDATLNPPGGAVSLTDFRLLARNSIGIKGGFMTLDSVEITGVQDGIQFQQPNAAGVSTITKPWHHGMLFYRGVGHAQPEGTHSDAFQIMLGGNLTVTGGLLGGIYDRTGYFDSDPAYNSGDDASNSCLMFKQENWNFNSVKDDGRVVDFITFDRVIMRGRGVNSTQTANAFNVNAPYNSSFPNTFPNSTVKDCLFEDRDDDRFVTRTSNLAGLFTNNKRFTLDADGNIVVGALIPYTNG